MLNLLILIKTTQLGIIVEEINIDLFYECNPNFHFKQCHIYVIILGMGNSTLHLLYFFACVCLIVTPVILMTSPVLHICN